MTYHECQSLNELHLDQRVRLRWNGFPGIPKWLTHDWATVKGIGRKRVTVQPDRATCTYKARPDQIQIPDSL